LLPVLAAWFGGRARDQAARRASWLEVAIGARAPGERSPAPGRRAVFPPAPRPARAASRAPGQCRGWASTVVL